MAHDQPQPSASESTSETHLDESNSARQQGGESEGHDNFELGFSLGGDASAENQFPSFSADSASGPEGFGIATEGFGITDASPRDESTAQQGSVTDVTAESDSLDAASMLPELSSAESAHLPEDSDSCHMEAEELSHPIDSPAADEHLPEAASTLAAEDSFTADAGGVGQSLAPTPALGQSAFANSAFDGDENDLFKESPYYNPMWDSGASPEQPSRCQSPFPGTSPRSGGQAGITAADRSTIQVRLFHINIV